MIVNKKKEAGAYSSIANNGGYGMVTKNAPSQVKIQLYDEHPQNVISLHDFHSIALNRLQALRKIEFM